MKSEKLNDFWCLILACILVWNAVILLNGNEHWTEVAASVNLIIGFLGFAWAIAGWLDRYEDKKRRSFDGPE